ncbi:MAG: serine hydrolase domain-containing protein, partial [Bacteroidota bacterium]
MLKLYLQLLVLSISLSTFGQFEPESFRLPDGRTIPSIHLDAYVRKAMDSLDLPGLSIAIINGNDIVFHNTYGVKNNVSKDAVTKKTMFEAASLSKPLFAYFIMRMVEENKLDLDETIFTYLEPIFPDGVVDPASLDYYKTLTPRIILSHGSGIPNWVRGKPIKIAFEPGTDFSYSGEAYQHLGAAFALKQGMDWGAPLDSLFIKDVALPMGMDNSLYTWDSKYENDVAQGHIDGKVNPEINRYKKVGPAFSLHTEAEDYAMFLIEMMNPKHISTSTRDE